MIRVTCAAAAAVKKRKGRPGKPKPVASGSLSLSEWRRGCAGWNCRRLRSQPEALVPGGSADDGIMIMTMIRHWQTPLERRRCAHRSPGSSPKPKKKAKATCAEGGGHGATVVPLPPSESAALGPGVPDVPASMRLPAARRPGQPKSRRRARPA
jgi:hypothetical protein